VTVVQLRRVATTRVSNVNKHSVEGEPAVRLCNYTDVYNNRVITADLPFMAATASPERVTAFRLLDGDTVITKDSETAEDIGVAAYIDQPPSDLICGYHLAILRPGPLLHPRFLTWSMRSGPVRECLASNATGMTRVGLTYDAIDRSPIHLASLEVQRKIADFLDDQISRIDRVVSARREQAALADSTFDRLVLEAIGGARACEDRRPSGLPWLGTVPASWPVLPVSSQFDTALGKMLDERRQTGAHPLPYLRNMNVQWDRIEIHDLKVMDIAPSDYTRYTVRAGDLLICEGGQPGRAAIWDGAITPLGFQKALHRARSRGRSEPRWLLHCLRAAVAMNAFAGENGVTTIGHLTGEQLRAQRFPFPDPQVQRILVAELDDAMAQRDQLKAGLARSTALLSEYKQSLITAAVTGDFDAATASGRRIPE